MKPFRVPLYDFPDVVLHADEMAVKRHPQYSAAKTGDADAAEVLVAHLASRSCVPNVAALLRGQAVRLLPVHALESEGVNEIPVALADLLSEWLGLPVTDSVVQSNTVGHTGASGFQRLANQAFFAGEVERGLSVPSGRQFRRAGRDPCKPRWVRRKQRRSRCRRYRLDRKTALRQA